jgi:hypothetical protein
VTSMHGRCSLSRVTFRPASIVKEYGTAAQMVSSRMPRTREGTRAKGSKGDGSMGSRAMSLFSRSFSDSRRGDGSARDARTQSSRGVDQVAQWATLLGNVGAGQHVHSCCGVTMTRCWSNIIIEE